MTTRHELASYLATVLKDFDLDGQVLKLDYPTDPQFGDFSTNISLMAAKKIGKNPRTFAEELKAKIEADKSDLLEKVEVAGPGFINFWMSPQYLLQKLSKNTDQDSLKELNKGKTVVVEYSSPNIAKPFTIGHLRSTIIGDAIANLLIATGWDVKRDNHVGDWGTQFGKQIYAIKEWGNEEEIENADRPVKLLVELYVRFHDEAEKDPTLEDKARAWFKKLEDRDATARDLWEKCIQWSWKEFDKIYEELDVTFTENGGKGYGESYFENKMSPVIDELKEKGLLSVGKEGAQIVEFAEDTKLPPLMILKKDGATLYATRDLATDKFRLEKYGSDVRVINEVGSEQSLYFQQLYKIEELLGWFKKEQRVHIKHGMFRFADKKMSTRKGNVIWLEDVLAEALDRAHELSIDKGFDHNNPDMQDKNHYVGGISIRSEITKSVAIGALKWNDLKKTSEQNVIFDWDEILNMQGNSGPYLQYTFARTQSVLRKSEDVIANTPLHGSKYPGGEVKQSPDGEEIATVAKGTLAMTKVLQPEERTLLRMLSRFADVVAESAEKFAPNMLCTYLFELAQAFNLFYQKHQILKEEEETKMFRLALTTVTGTVLKNGLTFLGIKTPEKM